mmetsp:Transcript_9053/g.19308  ORF Transcript_9053/g.19308 Transcript_9053/m.19308 type:complete len:213 (-) Transcript_9053:1707-2345(-)
MEDIARYIGASADREGGGHHRRSVVVDVERGGFEIVHGRKRIDDMRGSGVMNRHRDPHRKLVLRSSSVARVVAKDVRNVMLVNVTNQSRVATRPMQFHRFGATRRSGPSTIRRRVDEETQKRRDSDASGGEDDDVVTVPSVGKAAKPVDVHRRRGKGGWRDGGFDVYVDVVVDICRIEPSGQLGRERSRRFHQDPQAIVSSRHRRDRERMRL